MVLKKKPQIEIKTFWISVFIFFRRVGWFVQFFGGPLSIITFQRLYWTFHLQDCFAIGFGPHNLFSLTCVCCTGCCGLSFHLCTRRTTWEDSGHLDKHPWGFVGQWWDGGTKVLRVWMVQTMLVRGFKDFFMFIPTWGNDPISLIFFQWVVQSPSRWGFTH